jgi:hypothetical protein
MVFPVGQQLKRPTRKGNYFFWKGDHAHSCNADMLVCAPKGNWGSKWNPEKKEPPQTCLLSPVAWCFFSPRVLYQFGCVIIEVNCAVTLQFQSAPNRGRNLTLLRLGLTDEVVHRKAGLENPSKSSQNMQGAQMKENYVKMCVTQNDQIFESCESPGPAPARAW